MESVNDTEINYLSQDHLFSIYSMPGQIDHFVVIQDDSLKSNYSGNGSFLIAPFDNSSDFPFVKITPTRLVKNGRFHINITEENKLKSFSRDEYLDTTNDLIQLIKDGAFEKVVMSRIKFVPNRQEDLYELFLKLKLTYPNAFIYLFNIPNYGCWMGASPELLMQVNGSCKTVALAGTKPIDDEGRKQTGWASKERDEQAIIERYIEKNLLLQKYPFRKKGPFTVRAGNVMHLKSEYYFQTEDEVDYLAKLFHPTPAICGTPTEKAMEFIRHIEPHNRDYYSGYLGPVGIHDERSLFVNLRCMQIFENEMALYVGGGITKDSVANNEWDETELKARTLLAVLENTYIHADGIG